jgi:hypothetical protein
MGTWSKVNKVGLGLQFVYGLVNIPSILQEPGNDQEVGPPMGVLWADTILGVILVVAVIIAWRQQNRSTAWLASAANVLISLTAVPVFFIDGLPAWVEPVVIASIVWTIVSVTLTHLPNEDSATSAPAATAD